MDQADLDFLGDLDGPVVVGEAIAATPAVYVLEARPPHRFPYPGGSCRVLAIDATPDLRRSVSLIREFTLEARFRHDRPYHGQLWEYAAAFGVRMWFRATASWADAARRETALFTGFVEAFRAPPVAGRRSPRRFAPVALAEDASGQPLGPLRHPGARTPPRLTVHEGGPSRREGGSVVRQRIAAHRQGIADLRTAAARAAGIEQLLRRRNVAAATKREAWSCWTGGLVPLLRAWAPLHVDAFLLSSVVSADVEAGWRLALAAQVRVLSRVLSELDP